MITRISIVLLALCLILTPAVAQQTMTGLDALARISGPFVLMLYPSRQPPANPQSVAEVANAMSLKVFDEDGLCVIAPAERLDIGALFDGRIQAQKSSETLLVDLLSSLDSKQWETMGSSQGLSYSMLTEDQQATMADMFGPNRAVVNVDRNVETGPPSSAMPADSLPIASIRLHGCIETRRVEVRLCPPGTSYSKGEFVVGSGLSQSGPDAGWTLVDHTGSPANPAESPILPGLPVSNTLKPSDLDYSLDALKKPVPVQGKVTLKALVEAVAKETALDLRPSPGSDGVYIYVSASGIPAGKLLKAVSLTTDGTWRAFGSSYIFTVDQLGIGQIAARMSELQDDPFSGLTLALSWFTPQSQTNPIYYLPIKPSPEFPLSTDQMRMLIADIRSIDLHGLDWSQLSPEQQAIIGTKAESEINPSDKETLPLLTSDRSQWRVMPYLFPQLTFSFPSINDIELPDKVSQNLIAVFPPDNDLQLFGGMWSDVPRDHKVSLNKSIRACVHRPSRSDDPAALVSELTKHGFNTLLLRVFADGYTAFPSKQFPMRAGLHPDYLQSLISIAHSKGIKVFAVMDVLRWSDGTRDHWVMKKPELLDLDIYGRTHSEWGRTRAYNAVESSLMEFVYGEDISGEAVTPFSPQVASMLASLLDDLSSYEVDGLVLDYASMMHPEDGPEFVDMAAGCPGHHPLARSAFFATSGADSIDVGVGRLQSLPLQPIVQASAGLRTSWQQLYMSKATDLLISLGRKWTDVRKDSPVWVIDSFITRRASLDWPRLKGVANIILEPAIDFQSPSKDIPAYPIIRATDSLGTLLFYGMLARGLGYETEDIFKEMIGEKWDTQGIVVDLTNAGKRRAEYLRIIELPKSGSNTSAQTP